MMEDNDHNKNFPVTLGILSENTKVPKATLRAWVERGLIPILGYSPRTNYPLFDKNAEETVLVIRRLRNLGYGLNLIKDRLAKKPLQKLKEECLQIK